MDHISASKRLKSQGNLKLLIDTIQASTLFNFFNRKGNGDTVENNIFAPTAALNLFKHV